MFGNKIMIHVNIKTLVYSNLWLLIINIRDLSNDRKSTVSDFGYITF